jgi:hypothetical protein
LQACSLQAQSVELAVAVAEWTVRVPTQEMARAARTIDYLIDLVLDTEDVSRSIYPFTVTGNGGRTIDLALDLEDVSRSISPFMVTGNGGRTIDLALDPEDVSRSISPFMVTGNGGRTINLVLVTGDVSRPIHISLSGHRKWRPHDT